MRIWIRGLVLAVLAVVALTTVTGSASAVTVSPTGSYTASSGTIRLGWPSTGQSLTCTSSIFNIPAMSATGSGAIPRGTLRTTSCTNAILGTFTMMQTADWPVTVGLLAGPTGVSREIVIPRGGLQMSGPGCTYTVSGSMTLLNRVSALPARLSGMFVVSSAMTIDSNNSGLLCGFTPVGLAFTYSATYAISPAMDISG